MIDKKEIPQANTLELFAFSTVKTQSAFELHYLCGVKGGVRHESTLIKSPPACRSLIKRLAREIYGRA
jgi:hypothetical protein